MTNRFVQKIMDKWQEKNELRIPGRMVKIISLNDANVKHHKYNKPDGDDDQALAITIGGR